MPATICRDSLSPRSTLSFKSLSLPSRILASKIVPILSEVSKNWSIVIIDSIFASFLSFFAGAAFGLVYAIALQPEVAMSNAFYLGVMSIPLIYMSYQVFVEKRIG
jgi:uncharacterized MnhB-related membrane protein